MTTATTPTHALLDIPSAHQPPEEPPFVVLAGARGLGKSTRLRELRAAYTGRTPVALIDGEEARFDRPPPGRPPVSWSPAYEALSVIAEQLGEPVGGAGRITFPRLACGLLAVAAGGWGDRGLSRICAEAERALLLSDTGGWLAGRWVGKAVARLVSSMSDQGPVVEAIIEGALEAFSEGMSASHRRLRRGAVWYRDHPNAAGNPKLGLVLVSQHFRAGGDARTHAERHLVRALLADLDDAYTGVVPRAQRAGRPVILIDNVQEAAGRRLLESVLRDRADGRADQVAFFAGLRGQGHPALRNAARRALPEVTRTGGGWTPGGTPSSHALLVSLPPLSADETRQVVEATCTGLRVPPQLALATHRLTGGNPLGTALLAESARQNLPLGATELGDLLLTNMTAHDDHGKHNDHGKHDDHGEHDDLGRRPTYQVLLDRLLPAEDHLDELTVLATAHDHDSAVALAEAMLPTGFGESAVRALEQRLTAEGHTPAPDHFVSDPYLRSLLLLRLRHRDEARTDPHHAAWRTAHRTLAAHYATSPTHRAHHELALGDPGFAVTHLHDTFPETPAPTWLAALLLIASAPYHEEPPPHPQEGEPSTLHQHVRRLLHTVRHLTDPLTPPDPPLTDHLRQDLHHLAHTHPTDSEPLRRAARDWPGSASAGPLPGRGEATLSEAAGHRDTARSARCHRRR
ncbi:hypothetical protein ACWD26_33815 [Streptomyces sp. NPDC002787]